MQLSTFVVLSLIPSLLVAGRVAAPVSGRRALVSSANTRRRLAASEENTDERTMFTNMFSRSKTPAAFDTALVKHPEFAKAYNALKDDSDFDHAFKLFKEKPKVIDDLMKDVEKFMVSMNGKPIDVKQLGKLAITFTEKNPKLFRKASMLKVYLLSVIIFIIVIASIKYVTSPH
ncbi:hypothetical protein CCR75_000893 [Bremia lactucae]|uniref:RxLR effector protein n=1 Tax=Bremia lactucae TaxID=4779 RepID=A0A976FNF6_BRELC|nr:hypothetical protein CCR75_000893 [Bremia lactucae]